MEGAKLGRYRLGRRVASGGMAEVFAATIEGAEGFRKPVAIKRILPHLCEDPEFVDMFRDEARLASRLRHAAIAQVFDFDVIGGQYLLAMEWIFGRDLRRALRAAEQASLPLSPARAAHIAREVALALHHAHCAPGEDGEPLGMVHRDVSPQNILLSFAGEVKLTDFGIAKARSRSIATGVGIIKGKSAYMSPEQARGEDLDARSDIFSLGVVLWEMLTGLRLFTGDSDSEILRAVQLRTPASPSSHRAEVPEGLDEIVLRALSKNREERQGSARELAEELTNLLLRHVTGAQDLDLSVWMNEVFPAENREPEASFFPVTRNPRAPDGTIRQRRLDPETVSSSTAAIDPPAPGAAATRSLEESSLPPSKETADLPRSGLREHTTRARPALLVLGPVIILAAMALFVSTKYIHSPPESESASAPVLASEAPTPSPSSIVYSPALEASLALPEEIADEGGEAESHPDSSATTEEFVEPRPPRRPRPANRTRRSPSPGREAETTESHPRAVVSTADERADALESRGESFAPSLEPEERPAGGVSVLARGARVTGPQEPPPERQRTAVVNAGTRLNAELTVGVTGGEPGLLRARLTRSHTSGGQVLLPRGTALIGRASTGRERILIVFDRMSLPGGASIEIEAHALGDDGLPGLRSSEQLTGGARGGTGALTLPPGTGFTVVLDGNLTID